MSVKPHLSDDDDLDIRKVKRDVALKRSLFIRNELNKNRTIDSNLVQTLGCVELELASPVDCCIDIDVDCKILRTIDVIPNTIELHNKKLITRVGNILFTNKKFNFVPYDRFIFSGNLQYTKNDIYATLHGGRLYLKSNNIDHLGLKFIDIQGVFEDPTEAARFINCENNPCYSDDSPYPINMWMEDNIKTTLIEEYLKSTLKATKDMVNDGESKQSDNG
jgi:hypothetical protein